MHLSYTVVYLLVGVLIAEGLNDTEGFNETEVFNDSDLPERLKAIQRYGVYFSLNSTLAGFKEYYHLPYVRELMREVGERYRDIGQVDSFGKNHPFIAVEGIHRKTRNIVGVLLARKMGADVVYSPPKFMVQLGANISDVNLRKPFFGLTGYVAACTARHLTKTLPAVVTGHWMAQAAFAIAKVYDPVPPPESRVYSWPSDLYPPDIVFFINSQRKKENRRSITDPVFLSNKPGYSAPMLFLWRIIKIVYDAHFEYIFMKLGLYKFIATGENHLCSRSVTHIFMKKWQSK